MTEAGGKGIGKPRRALGVFGTILVVLLIGRLLGVGVSRSVHPVGFEHPENELIMAIEARRSGPAQRSDEITRIIRDDPDQLLEPGPVGELALDHAVSAGLSDVIEHLLLDVPRVYAADYLIRVAQDAHRLGHDHCLPYFAFTIPADKPRWYASEIEHQLGEWDIQIPSERVSP